jgi:predicted PurR-regulated permease PerM
MGWHVPTLNFYCLIVIIVFSVFLILARFIVDQVRQMLQKNKAERIKHEIQSTTWPGRGEQERQNSGLRTNKVLLLRMQLFYV